MVDRVLYLAMNGAKQAMLAQTAHSNNLANVKTDGFKADFEQFRSLPVFGETHPSRVFAATERPGSNFNPGPVITTGRDLDIYVKDDAWIAVQGEDGNEAYTRVGNLRVTPTGQLVTGNDLPVLGNAGPIAIPPAETLEIGVDGTISIRPLGQGANALATLDRIKLVQPDLAQLEKGLDGLFRQQDGFLAPIAANVQVQSGALEGSNVNPIQELTEIIGQARQYELNVKLMEAAQENDEATARLLQIRG